MIDITVNGSQRRVAPGLTLQGLIESLGLDARWVVAERNHEAVSRDRFAHITLEAGDLIELVRAVAGG